MRSLMVLYFLFSAAIAIGWASEEVRFIQSGGRITSRSATKTLRIRIEHHPDNRKLSVVCDSGDFYRYSEQDLEGEKSPLEIQLELNLASGRYECRATLYRQTDNKNIEFYAKTEFIVF